MLDEWKLLRVVGSAKDRCHGEPQELDGLGKSLNSANAFGAAGPCSSDGEGCDGKRGGGPKVGR
jgi:hypothetical protein